MYSLLYIVKVLILGLFILSACKPDADISNTKTAENPLRLWYTAPAEDWMLEALPFGNGYMGAMYFGDPHEEHIQSTWKRRTGNCRNSLRTTPILLKEP